MPPENEKGFSRRARRLFLRKDMGMHQRHGWMLRLERFQNPENLEIQFWVT
jgi:hypothetical protein